MAAAAVAGGGFGGSKKVVEIFYDVVSPYSWLGFEVRREPNAGTDRPRTAGGEGRGQRGRARIDFRPVEVLGSPGVS